VYSTSSKYFSACNAALQPAAAARALANHQPISAIPKLVAKAIGVMAHITYQLDLESLLTTSFKIIQKRILYRGLVQLFVGEPRARVNDLE
jgi:hypothetical protein